MPQPRVSIRLGTDGKASVQKDFADIGDAGDAAAQRIAASFQRKAAAAEAALEDLNKSAQRLAAVSPNAAGLTNSINPITGGSYAQADSRAEASARAIQQQMLAGEQSAQRLLASIDPLYAAQMRYDQALAEANSLQRQGLLTTEQLTAVQTGLKAQLNDQTMLYGKQGGAIGNARIAQMELMHVVRGSVDQFAAGAPPMQIFTMHLGMLGQAAALSGESMGKLGAFMSSGWGLALTVAVVALGPLIAKLIEGGDAVDHLVDKLKDEARQQALNDEAHKAFALTLEGVEQSVRALDKAMAEYEHRLQTTSEKELDAARLALKTAEANRIAAQAALDRAKAEGTLAFATNTGSAAAGMTAELGVEQRIAAGQAALDQSKQAAADAQRALDFFQSAVTAEKAQGDEVERIKQKYAGLIEAARRKADLEAQAARRAGDQARAQALVTVELDKQVRALAAKEKAEEDAARARDRKGPANAGGTAIFNAQIASFFDIANKYRGDSETSDKKVLESFFRAANENLDPEKVKWCAAFVNAVLAAGGVKGTGSLAAKSFLTYGKDDTRSPQKGDIAVVLTNAGYHVGFVDSTDKAGNVTMLAGNTGNKVAEATYSKNQVQAIRRPPTPSESAADDAKAADEEERAREQALREQGLFDDQRARLNDQYLTQLGKVVLGYAAQASVQLSRAQADHDAEAAKIATNLAEGKYGAATGKLAQSRAAQLNQANDSLLMETRAAIALASYIKSLEAQDAAAERDTKYRLEGLRYAESIARTARQRRALQLQIIDIEYDEKKKHLEYLLALDQLTGNTKDAADIAAQLAHLPEEKGRDQANAERGTMGPLEEFFKQLPQNAAEANDAFQKIAANGLQSLNDGLADAIVNSKSLGDVFHNVAKQMMEDMIKLVLQEAEMALFKAITGAASGGAPVQGNASGTDYFGGGATWVGEFGKELVTLPRGSKITPAGESRRIAAANDQGIGAIHVTNVNDFRGADPSAVAAINAKLDRMQQQLPTTIVQTVQDARTRFVLRG